MTYSLVVKSINIKKLREIQLHKCLLRTKFNELLYPRDKNLALKASVG
jgi:hypothetical protein